MAKVQDKYDNEFGWQGFNEDEWWDRIDGAQQSYIIDQFQAVMPLGYPRERIAAAVERVQPRVDVENYSSRNRNVRICHFSDFKKIISLLK